jgi:hypothetical protein
MLYQPPFGSSDPNAPYVDRSTSGATRGSIPPAAAIENPQREIVDAISKSGQTPATGLQLSKAIRSQALNYFTAGGTANALTITPNPAFAALADLVGVPLRILISTANAAGGVTLNVSGLGVVAVTSEDGAALPASALTPGAIPTLIYNGTTFRLAGFAASRMPPRNTQVFSTAGTVNFTVPAGIYALFCEVEGAGGGAAVAGYGTSGAGGEGGGGGGYASGWIDVSPGQVIAVTCGAAGVTSISGSNGTAGGTSSVGAFMSATGGAGATSSGSPGLGGIGTGGSLNLRGGSGADGSQLDNTSLFFGGSGAGPIGGQGGCVAGGAAVWPGGGAGIMVIPPSSATAAPAAVGGVIIRW